jgi:hypothetical protein
LAQHTLRSLYEYIRLSGPRKTLQKNAFRVILRAEEAPMPKIVPKVEVPFHKLFPFEQLLAEVEQQFERKQKSTPILDAIDSVDGVLESHGVPGGENRIFLRGRLFGVLCEKKIPKQH